MLDIKAKFKVNILELSSTDVWCQIERRLLTGNLAEKVKRKEEKLEILHE